MRNLIATFDSLPENLTNRQKANRVLKALNLLTQADNGTIRNPFELASSVMPDGRTLIQTVSKDGFLRYNDGWNIVEIDDSIIYCDITTFAIGQIWGENTLKLMQENDDFCPYKYVGDLV